MDKPRSDGIVKIGVNKLNMKLSKLTVAILLELSTQVRIFGKNRGTVAVTLWIFHLFSA
jgi:hypothetical protein